ncbi:MAG: hypothetical protein HRT64_10415 [Erythrobacter sp.]|nr:hypothetical protein [Erythrobacter sp.]
MTCLEPREHRKLVAILGRLGSDQDGEKVAAANAAQALLRRSGMSWGEVLAPARLEAPANSQGEYWPGSFHKRSGPEPINLAAAHKDLARALLQTGAPWTENQRDFLRKMAWLERPSEKQRNWLKKLRAKVVGEAA